MCLAHEAGSTCGSLSCPPVPLPTPRPGLSTQQALRECCLIEWERHWNCTHALRTALG